MLVRQPWALGASCAYDVAWSTSTFQSGLLCLIFVSVLCTGALLDWVGFDSDSVIGVPIAVWVLYLANVGVGRWATGLAAFNNLPTMEGRRRDMAKGFDVFQFVFVASDVVVLVVEVD